MVNPLTKKVKDEFNFETRKKILMNMREVDFQKHFKSLLERIYPNDIIEIRQGPDEYGKDIVRIASDKMMSQVYAYIVKMGNIRGQVNSDVENIKKQIDIELKSKEKVRYEEIREQIEEAKIHKAEFNVLLNKLQVNFIFVILVGELSKKAKEKLTKEVMDRDVYSGVVQFISIKELDELFVENYPEVYLENKNIAELQKIIDKIENLHYLGKNNISLNDYFVPPRISHLSIDELARQGTGEKLSLEEIMENIKESKFGYSHLFHLIKEKKHILLLGNRGIGKTTILQKITQDLLQNAMKELLNEGKNIDEVSIPLYISARELLKEDIDQDNIRENILGYPYKINVLLVDGLDEISRDNIDKLITKAKNIAYSFHSGLIITSRYFKDIDNLGNSLKKYKLLDFEFSQAIDLVEKILKKKTKNFSRILEQIKIDLQKLEHQIPMFPLSILMIIEILESNNHHELPSSITEIYDRYIEAILWKWDKEKKGLELLFGYKIKQSFLEELAYKEFFEKDRIVITKEEYDIALKTYTTNHSEIYDIEKFNEEIMNSGILKERRNEIEFSHKSFLDYFIAKYLKDYSDDILNIKDILAQSFLSEKWEDVTFFFIGLKGKLDKDLLEKFIDYYKDDESYHAWSLFRLGLLLQAGWQTESSIKELALAISVEEGIPAVRKDLLSTISRFSLPLPRIIVDILIFESSKNSYSSIFIKDVAVSYIKNTLIPKGNIYESVILLKALSTYFNTEDDKKELENIILSIDEKIREVRNIYNHEKLYISQIALTHLTDKNFPKISKKLKKELRKFTGKYSESLFPYIIGRTKSSVKKRFLK